MPPPDQLAITTELVIKLQGMIVDLSKEARDRDERREQQDRERWDRYHKERLEHQVDHGKIYKWQSDAGTSFRDGGKKMGLHDKQIEKLQTQIRPTYGRVGVLILVAAGVVGWFYDRLDKKADKTDLASIKTTVHAIADKMGIPTNAKEGQ